MYSIWEYGQRKDAYGNPHQEDNMYPAHGEGTENDRLFVLCDGMGGHDAGEVASATVCEAMSRSVLASAPDAEGGFSREMFDKALNDAFAALDERDNGAEKKMGTTMTFLKLYDKGCFIAHMGDSRVYHIRPGQTEEDTRILFHTEDHSLVNDLVRIGELTPEEARHSRQKNVITRAMQPHLERRPKADVYTSADIQAGDYFYLCTDGMLENMENGNICYFFSKSGGTDEEKVGKLIDATCENRDNHSAIIVHILEVIDPVQKAPAPALSKPRVIMADVEDNPVDKDDKTDTPADEPEETATEETDVAEAPAPEETVADNETTEAGEETTEETPEDEKTEPQPVPSEGMQEAPSRGKHISRRSVFMGLIVLVVALILAFLAVLLTGGDGDQPGGKTEDKTEQNVTPQQPDKGGQGTETGAAGESED